jgi:hypothetical protein
LRIKVPNVSYTVLVSGFLGGVGLAITFTGVLFVVAIANFIYENLMTITGYITNPTSQVDISSFIILFAISSLPLGLVGLAASFIGQIPREPRQIISLRFMKVTRGGLYEFLTIYTSLILFAFFMILLFPPVFSMLFAPGILVFGLFLADILHDIWLWWARKLYRLLTRRKAISWLINLKP